MKNLAESQKRRKTCGNGRSQYVKTRDLSGITCFQCHKKGYFQDNYPFVNNLVAIYRKEETPATVSEAPTEWKYKRPENGEPDTKVVNDTTYNFSKMWTVELRRKL